MKNYTLIFILLIFILVTCKEEQLPEIEIKHKIDLELTLNDINGNSANLTCNLFDVGNVDISEYGLCWNISGNPTTDDYVTKANLINDTIFSKSITELVPDTDYYIKGFLTINGITIYGDQIKISTSNGLPALTTTAISDITAISAASGGNITDDGGFAITARGVCWRIHPNPEITDAHTTDGSGMGSFSSSLTGLTEWSTYYVRAYATNSNGTAYGDEVSFTTIGTSVTDYDENVYEIVQIGNQIWMAENLKTTHYADGTAIPLVTDNTAWANLGDNNTDDAYCYYNNDANSQYGALYTWAAAMNGAVSSTANPSGIQGACPDGWHLPSDAEWTELTDYLGGASVAGGKMKETGTTHWTSPNTGATNESGFTALPGGRRSFGDGSFDRAGNDGTWWSSTELSSTTAYTRLLYYSTAEVNRGCTYQSYGFSVRCVKD